MRPQELSRTVLEVIPRAMAAIRVEMRGSASADLSVVQFRVLAYLAHKSLSSGELAAAIGVGLPAMSRLVDALVRKGLVSRAPDATDRRRVSLSLTARGQRAFGRIRGRAGTRLSGLFEGLGERERRELGDTLKKLDRVLRAGALALLVTFAATGARAATEAPAAIEPLSLEEAVSRALEHNPSVRKAREHESEVDHAVSQAWSMVFPELNLSLLAQHRKDSLNTAAPLFDGEPYNFYQFGFQLTQPLFRGGAILNGLKSARASREVGRVERQIVERDLTAKVLEAYYNLLEAQLRLETLERDSKVQKELLDTAKARARIGRSQRLDVLQVSTNLALLEPKIAEARNQLDVAGSELAALLGESDARAIAVRGSLDGPSWERIQELKKKASRPAIESLEVARLDYLRDRTEGDRGVTLARHFPQINAVATWGRSSFVRSEIFDEDADAWTLGLQAQIPLFSGLSSVFERRRLSAQLRSVEADRDGAADGSALERVRTEKELAMARDTTEASRRALDLARESLKEAQKNYRLSTSDYPALLTSERSLLEAEMSYHQARRDYLVRMARYFSAWGYDLRDLVKELGEKS